MSGHLVVQNVVKSYPTRQQPLVVIRGVSLEMHGGQNLALIGPSGSGKSTLLHMLGTLETPSEGEVRLNGMNPFELTAAALAEFRNRQIGFIFQEHFLLPQLTVLENILVPVLASKSPDAATLERARDLMARVGLADRRDHRPAELSGGERQRVAVARALINRPALLLADEPTGSLDRTNAQAIATLLLEMQQAEQAMLIVVTHSASVAERFQRCFELDEGKLVPHGVQA